MKSKYDYDNILLGLPDHDNHTFIIICKYETCKPDRFTTDSLSWARDFNSIHQIINLNVWPKHKKGIII